MRGELRRKVCQIAVEETGKGMVSIRKLSEDDSRVVLALEHEDFMSELYGELSVEVQGGEIIDWTYVETPCPCCGKDEGWAERHMNFIYAVDVIAPELEGRRV